MAVIRKNRGRPLKGDALRERVSFTLSPKLHRDLKVQAKKLHLSKSELVERKMAGVLEPDQIEILYAFTKLKRKIDEIARRNEIKRLSLFGSVLTGETTPESDIDLLVEFKEGNFPGLFKLASIEMELSQTLNGRKVDLRTIQDLSKYFRNEVKDSAISIYES